MKTTTDITIILDRSASMSSIKSATIEGYNSFLKEQKSSKNDSAISLIQFDDQYETVYENQNIESVANLNNKSFEPRGMTALIDAIGLTINSTKKRIKALPKDERPKSTIIAIITDGFENASTKYTRKEIYKMIRKREEKDQWNFVFIGANQDAIHEAHSFGISGDKALTFSADSNGIKDALNSFSSNIAAFSDSNLEGFQFNNEDRKKQEREISKNTDSPFLMKSLFKRDSN